MIHLGSGLRPGFSERIPRAWRATSAWAGEQVHILHTSLSPSPGVHPALYPCFLFKRFHLAEVPASRSPFQYSSLPEGFQERQTTPTQIGPASGLTAVLRVRQGSEVQGPGHLSPTGRSRRFGKGITETFTSAERYRVQLFPPNLTPEPSGDTKTTPRGFC